MSKVKFPNQELRALAIYILLLAFCDWLFASVWSISGSETLFSNKDQIEWENVLLPATGNIRLAPAVSLVCSLDEDAIWQLALSPRSNSFYLGTGRDARLYRYSPGKKPFSVFSGEKGELLAVTVRSDGTVFFGTTPEGKVYSLSEGGTGKAEWGRQKVKTLFTTGETYVFSLLLAPDGSVLCATGPNGKLFRITPDGKGEVLFTAPQAHLVSLFWLEPGKELLVGTSPAGIVYRLRFSAWGEKPDVAVLYDTPQNEVRAIVVGNDRRLYFAANPDDDDTSTPAVYCLDRDGFLRWQWSCPESTIFNLAWLENRLVVLTGSAGMVYALDTLGKPAILSRLDAAYAVAATFRAKELCLATANPARVYLMRGSYSDSGFVTSPVFDCNNPARFGRIDIKAKVPSGTGLLIDTRSGNSAIPDSTWSNWREVKDKITSPPARFIQWRARLYTNSANSTPELQRVDLYYSSVNRPPVISRLEISTPLETDARKGTSQPKRQVTWEATDPDGDSLLFKLFIKPEGEQYSPGRSAWQELGKEIAENRYELDTHTIPDGWYVLRLVASDQPDRPEKTALFSEYISPPFLIDNTPPVISQLKVTGKRATWTVTDNLSPVIACRISVNAGQWNAVEPEDGVFDAKEEIFSCGIELVSAGHNTIAIWATDAFGNVTTKCEISR